MLHHRATWETQCILQSLINSCSVLFRKEDKGKGRQRRGSYFYFRDQSHRRHLGLASWKLTIHFCRSGLRENSKTFCSSAVSAGSKHRAEMPGYHLYTPGCRKEWTQGEMQGYGCIRVRSPLMGGRGSPRLLSEGRLTLGAPAWGRSGLQPRWKEPPSL